MQLVIGRTVHEQVAISLKVCKQYTVWKQLWNLKKRFGGHFFSWEELIFKKSIFTFLTDLEYIFLKRGWVKTCSFHKITFANVYLLQKKCFEMIKKVAKKFHFYFFKTLFPRFFCLLLQASTFDYIKIAVSSRRISEGHSKT